LARGWRMYSVPNAGPKRHPVGGRLDRRVRHHRNTSDRTAYRLAHSDGRQWPTGTLRQYSAAAVRDNTMASCVASRRIADTPVSALQSNWLLLFCNDSFFIFPERDLVCATVKVTHSVRPRIIALVIVCALNTREQSDSERS
jgi:hypothetical protein